MVIVHLVMAIVQLIMTIQYFIILVDYCLNLFILVHFAMDILDLEILMIIDQQLVIVMELLIPSLIEEKLLILPNVIPSFVTIIQLILNIIVVLIFMHH